MFMLWKLHRAHDACEVQNESGHQKRWLANCLFEHLRSNGSKTFPPRVISIHRLFPIHSIHLLPPSLAFRILITSYFKSFRLIIIIAMARSLCSSFYHGQSFHCGFIRTFSLTIFCSFGSEHFLFHFIHFSFSEVFLIFWRLCDWEFN